MTTSTAPRTRQIKGENLTALRMAFDALVKAGDESIRAAYNAGQIDALINLYTYETMAEAVNRSTKTIAKYARLYRRYPTFDALLLTAHRYDTYDISILLGSDETLGLKFGYQCGSWDTHRTRKEQ